MSDLDYPGDGGTLDGSCGGCVVAICGLAAVFSSFISGFSDLRYHFTGRTVPAEVANTWQTGYKRTTTTLSDYDFTVDGKTYSGEIGGTPRGSTVLVEYLPSNPEINRVVGTGTWLPVGPILLVLGIGAIVVGLIVNSKLNDPRND